MTYQLWLGDCLEEMSRIEDGSIDMILADLPYGTTACKWDVVIPFEPLWKQYKRVIKRSGAVVLFGSEPFSSLLRLSNLDWYKYDWVWDKVATSSGLNAKVEPLRCHENIIIFCKGSPLYTPQMTTGKQWHR
jgi:DNA modification methylase